MKLFKPTILAATVALLGVQAATAQEIPYNKPEIRKIDLCLNPSTGANCKKRELTKAERREMMSYLASVDYPAKIVLDSKANYDNVNFGWQSVTRCKAAPRNQRSIWPDMRTGNLEIDQARVTYCLASKNGWPVPKPEIVLQLNRSKNQYPVR